MSFRSIMVTAACLLSSGPVFAEVIRVCPDGGDYTTIQAGIDAAADGDEVLVCDGVYRGTGNRAIDFHGKAIVVRSENGPRTCILDCELQATGFYFRMSEDERSVVAGFTIVNGRSGSGGGFLITYNSSPTIRNCIIDGCVAGTWGMGGGILCCDSNPLIENCLIVRCTTTENGGAIACRRSNPRFDHCTIVGNGGAVGGGGAFYGDDSNPVIRNCIIWANGRDPVQSYGNGHLLIEYSNVDGGFPGEGNLQVEPRLTRRLDRLRSGSPCIDAGDPNESGDGFDLDGEARRTGDRTDIGADEFLDENADALADAWEILHFGGIDQADPEADPDGDSRINLAEFEESFDPHVAPTTYYVDLGGDDGWDGLAPEYDGTHGPKATLQGGIGAAALVETDAVVVADGLYRGVGNKNLDLLGKPLTLRSANGARACTIDCQGEGRAFHLRRGESPATTIEGFTLRRGRVIDDQGGALVFCQNSGMTMRACIVEDGEALLNLKGQYGGGLLLLGGAVRIEDTVVRDNQAWYGGGGIYSRGCDLALIGCRVTGNCAEYTGGGISALGGRIFTMSQCSVSGNRSIDGAAGVDVSSFKRVKIRDCDVFDNEITEPYANGGGIYSSGNAHVRIDRCQIHGNAATGGGGGLESVGDKWFQMQRSLIEQNTCDEGGGAGISVSNGRKSTFEDCVIRENFSNHGEGSGVRLRECEDISFADCSIEDNFAYTHGGGAMSVDRCALDLDRCIIQRNRGSDGGGGIHAVDSEVTLRGCLILENEAVYSGAGVEMGRCIARLVGCTIRDNIVVNSGGGLTIGESDVVIASCTIAHNRAGGYAVYDYPFVGGGGLRLGSNSRVVLVNNLVTGNVAAQHGGGLHSYDNHNFHIVNCTFVGNHADKDGGGMFVFSDRCELVNTIMWDNSATRGNQSAILNDSDPQRRGVLSVHYSDVEAGEGGIYVGEHAELNWGGGNTDRDPKFLSAEDGDYRLGTHSACIDAGSNSAVPTDELDLDGDGDTAEPTPFDHDGLARFVDSPCAEDRGEGAPPMVDMGAHEYAGSEENPCPTGSTIRARHGEGGVGVRLSGLLCDRAYALELRSASGDLVAESVANTDARGRAEVRFDAVACEGAPHRVTLPVCGQEEDVHGGCR